MKIIKQIFFFSFLLLLLICCNDTSTEPLQQNYLDNFPVGIGSSYKYSVTEKDSNGNIVQSGTRNIFFSGSTIYNGINYTTQTDSLDFESQSSVSSYLVRKSETGIFYAVDTSQVSQLIPDTLKQYVTLRNEMQLLFYPLTTGSSWSLYRITAEIQSGVEIKILDVISSFDKAEQVDLNLISGIINVTAQKVKYTLELFSGIGSPPQTYSAFMWYVEDIGLIKFEGNQFIVNIGEGGISFEPSSNILTQELIDYSISE